MQKSKQVYDVVVLGAGAAGLMCALTAGGKGKHVLVIEVSNKPGKKILMSGGGRCNFTNLEVNDNHFICDNPHFVKSALSQYSQWDFIALVVKHNIAYHEKSHGQLFCDGSAKEILAMLLDECADSGVEIQTDCDISAVSDSTPFRIECNRGEIFCTCLVVATGGLSIPTLGGATGLGYKLAAQFGLSINPTSASLVPLTLTGRWHELSQTLSGVSVAVSASVAGKTFSDKLLFTHRGVSGPVILQLSNYWHPGDLISIDLLPDTDIRFELLSGKKSHPNSSVSSCVSKYLPKSLVLALSEMWWHQNPSPERSLQTYTNSALLALADQLHNWQFVPSGTEGYRTAEVTRGGVDVAAISSKSMQVVDVEGLYYIGEVLDVTGQLGGYNFQWAWSSGYVAGMSV